MYLCVQYSYNRETNYICLSKKKKKKNLKLKSNTVIYIYMNIMIKTPRIKH